MVQTLAGPGKYIQGNGILGDIYSHIKFIGKKFIVITDDIVLTLIEDKIQRGFEGTEGQYKCVRFGGESTEAEANQIALIAKRENAEGIIGAGGGKVIDSAKYVGNLLGIPVVIIPTAASSDAPCSAVSVIYDEEGSFVAAHRVKRNADVVFVDTGIIAEAPVRLLVAGIGDAYATYFEARACHRSGAANYTGGVHTEAGYAIAKLCREILLKYGYDAKLAVEKKQWSEALDKVVEANIYLSGVGFENNGCAIAHAFYNGLTAVLKPFPVMHGEGVALGTLVQLAAEYQNEGKWNDEEWEETLVFYHNVGLPTKLKDIGVDVQNNELLDRIAEAICTQSINAHKMPFKVTPEVIKDALIRVDSMN